MSHDADKLSRQLSLVAYLMAERRPLTARDIKGNVEGYQEMSDEAFARRFYSDRAELVALGVPLDSQRDEFTGEELYTLRSERYFLPALELEDDELAALQTCLYLLEGRFAYAEPLRVAVRRGRRRSEDRGRTRHGVVAAPRVRRTAEPRRRRCLRDRVRIAAAARAMGPSPGRARGAAGAARAAPARGRGCARRA